MHRWGNRIISKYILFVIISILIASFPGTTWAQNASKSVFYLIGNSGGKTIKTCKIPAGLGLLIPIIVVEASQAETPGATIEDLNRIAKNDQDHVTSLSLRINGTEYKYEDLLKYRTHTKDFDVIFPDNAEFGAA